MDGVVRHEERSGGGHDTTAAAQKKGLRRRRHPDRRLRRGARQHRHDVDRRTLDRRRRDHHWEPTDLDSSIAHKGFTWLELETHGTAAHGSRPDLGVDAIAKMGKILVELERLDENLRAGKPHRLLGTGSIHASLISGGQELSSYPDLCRLDIERRTIPNEDAAIVEKQIQSIISRVSESDPSVRATIRTGLVREPYEIDEDAPIVTLLRKQAAAKLGSAPEIGGETGWMDSAILGAAGIPTVIFGPAGDGAHAIEEWVDLESVETCANVLVAVLEEFCA
ncbi:MAG: M20/M25/M40 family metallo-hydrolase [Thermomicrobiales bacterium]